VKKWGGFNIVPEIMPAIIKDGTEIDRANGAYELCTSCNKGKGWDWDSAYPNWIIELSIPKSAIGGPGSYNAADFSITDNCTNDNLTIIPEFATVALPIAAILGLVFIVRMRRKEN
ncbi:MAG TPA: PEF-CTERM sorting domain-containing protein, partial [Candidatus Methanoperedens sp.]